MHFEEAKQNVLDALSEAENRSDGISEIVTSEEFAGSVGCKQRISGNKGKSEIEEITQESIDELRNKIESADDFYEMIHAISAILDNPYEETFRLGKEENKSPVPNILIWFLQHVEYLLEEGENISSVKLHDIVSGLAQELKTQKVLKEGTAAMGVYMMYHVEESKAYANTFITGIIENIDEVSDIYESDETNIEELVELNRKTYTYLEHGLPPVLAMIYYLQDDEFNPDKISDMHLSTSLDKARSFDPLSDIFKSFDKNIRNAISHGGDTFYRPNPIKEEILFRYRVENSKESKTLSFLEFKKHSVESFCSAIALYLIPLYFILFATKSSIESKL
jgi:hypothetical protein